jgi:hypothetical protein
MVLFPACGPVVYESLGGSCRCETGHSIETPRYQQKTGSTCLGGIIDSWYEICFPADYGGIVRGLPTSYAGPPINKHILSTDSAVPIWPHPKGDTQGMAWLPMYKSVSDSCMIDSVLYDYLVITDALRGGSQGKANCRR